MFAIRISLSVNIIKRLLTLSEFANHLRLRNPHSRLTRHSLAGKLDQKIPTLLGYGWTDIKRLVLKRVNINDDFFASSNGGDLNNRF